MNPTQTSNTLDKLKNIDINVQKEMINAINALIYNEQRKKQPNVHISDGIKRIETGNINQFMIPNTCDKELRPFSDYFKSGAHFSSQAYKIACEAMFEKKSCIQNELDINIIKKAVSNLNLILKKNEFDYNLNPFYILSNIWKSIYYINHDLRIDALIQLRSVFESLVRSKFKLKTQEKIKKESYSKYCKSDEINDFFKDISAERNKSVHELLISSNTNLFQTCARYLFDFFKRDFKLDISNIGR